jgi:transposase InsO family protein
MVEGSSDRVNRVSWLSTYETRQSLKLFGFVDAGRFGLYLAVMLDAFSRRIVGWSMATALAKRLVLDVLNMALATRRAQGVLRHSDRGSRGGFN